MIYEWVKVKKTAYDTERIQKYILKKYTSKIHDFPFSAQLAQIQNEF